MEIKFGLKKKLLSAWKMLLRPITEYAAPLWHSGLTKCDSEKHEKLQKRLVGLILGTTYVNFERRYKVNCKAVTYEVALKYLKIPKLVVRRESLSRKFAIDTFNNERHKDFFEKKAMSDQMLDLSPLFMRKHAELTDSRIQPSRICQDC